MEGTDQKPVMSELMVEVEGPEGIFAIFSEDEGAAYFFAYRPETQTVLAQIRVYVCSEALSIRESDVHVMWSPDKTKGGVVIYGQLRGVLDIASGREVCMPLEHRLSPAITAPEWLKAFGMYLSENQFIKARQRYWKELLKEYESDVQPLPDDETPIQTNFIVYAKGPNQTFAIFEDDGKSGYLYLYSTAEQTVLRHLHVYDLSSRLHVVPEDVQVLWAAGETKCGVAIWGKMRGIIDIESGGEGRVWMESRDTPGIGDQKWLEGF